MKSALRQVKERRISFHLKPQAEDFIQTCLDFILLRRISFLLFFKICDILVPRGDIARLCLAVIFYSSDNSRSEYHLDAVQISLRSNITRRRRYILCFDRTKKIQPRILGLDLLLFLIQEQIKIKLGDKRFEACQLFLVLL